MTPLHSQVDSNIFSLLTYYAACIDSPTAAFQKYNLAPINQHLLSVKALCHFYFVNLFINWTPKWPVLFFVLFKYTGLSEYTYETALKQLFQSLSGTFWYFLLFCSSTPTRLFVNNSCSLGAVCPWEMLKILLVSEEIKRLAISNLCSQSHILTHTVCSWFTVCVIYSSACVSHFLSCIHSIEPEAVCVSLSEWDWERWKKMRRKEGETERDETRERESERERSPKTFKLADPF